jgi:hypothetical protein
MAVKPYSPGNSLPGIFLLCFVSSKLDFRRFSRKGAKVVKDKTNQKNHHTKTLSRKVHKEDK